MTKPQTDADILKRINDRGGILTTLDIEQLTDANSIDNVVKKAYDEMQQNAELEEFIKEKLELRMAMCALLNSLIADAEWREQLKEQRWLQKKIDLQNASIEEDDDKLMLPEHEKHDLLE